MAQPILDWLVIEDGKIQYLNEDPLDFSIGKDDQKNLNLFQESSGWKFKFREIPIQWAFSLFPNISLAKKSGSFSGFINLSSDFKIHSVEVSSDWIDFNFNQIHCSGALFFKWRENRPNFSISNCSFKGDGIFLENIDISLGPIDWNFGTTKGTWEEGADSIDIGWKNLGSNEVMLFKKFFPYFQNFQMHSGNIQGKMKICQNHVYDQNGNQKFSVNFSRPTDFHLIMNELHGDALDFEYNQIRFTGDIHWKDECGKFQGQCLDNPFIISFIQLDSEICFEGDFGEFKWEGRCGKTDNQWYVQIPNFSGRFPHFGIVEAKERGFQLLGTDYQIDASLKELNYLFLKNIQCNFSADSSGIHILDAKGWVEISSQNQNFTFSLYSPQIRLEKENSYFDIRALGEGWDLGRIVGKKIGAHIEIDDTKSHLCGEPLYFSNIGLDHQKLTHLNLSFQFPHPILRYLEKHSHFYFDSFEKLLTESKTDSSGYFNLKDPIFVNCSYSFQNFLEIDMKGTNNRIYTQIQFDPKGYCVQKLEANLDQKMNIEMQGFISKELQSDFQIHKIGIDGSLFSLSKGMIEGKGQLSMNAKGVESDLTLVLKGFSIADFEIENKEPFRFFYSSTDGILLKNIDCVFQNEKEKGYLQMDDIQFDSTFQNGFSPKTHFTFKEMNSTFDLQIKKNSSEWIFQSKEGFIAHQMNSHRIKECKAILTPQRCKVEGELEHQGLWIQMASDVDLVAKQGMIHLKDFLEKGDEKMEIQFEYTDLFKIHSLVGKIAGIDAKFYQGMQGLVGEAHLNFKILSKFVPKDVSEVFSDLEMGTGYTIKGNLSIDPIQFDGILIGKNFELFGNEFYTLFSNISMSQSHVVMDHLKISDKAVCFDIERIFLQGASLQPWTIEIPKFHLTNLRPSLLHKPKKAVGELTPLLVKELSITDFQGILDDPNSYQAKGTLSFLNTFRREKTVFDLPSNFFSRFIGIDLELLIPVEGELSFSLANRMFYISSLQNAFSEARRSQFFLPIEKFPAMDLEGNLHIELKMKHFVLFALTEGFTISISGKLNHPTFGLVKAGSIHN